MEGGRGALRDVLITVEGKRRGRGKRFKEKHRERVWERGGGGKVR